MPWLTGGDTTPKEYEAMRDRFIRQGMPVKAAKAKAARNYNAKHPSRPVTRASHPSRGPR